MTGISSSGQVFGATTSNLNKRLESEPPTQLLAVQYHIAPLVYDPIISTESVKPAFTMVDCCTPSSLLARPLFRCDLIIQLLLPFSLFTDPARSARPTVSSLRGCCCCCILHWHGNWCMLDDRYIYCDRCECCDGDRRDYKSGRASPSKCCDWC